MLGKIRKVIFQSYLDWQYPHLWDVIKGDKVIIPYYGYLGDYNYGDVMVYEATMKLLADRAYLIPIRKFMPFLLKAYLKRKTKPRRKIIIGGGTLMASAWEKEFFYACLTQPDVDILFHGTGSTSGINDEKFWSELISRSKFGGLRGPLSAQVISEKLNLNAAVVGDAALSLYDKSVWDQPNNPKRESLLLNIGTHHEFDGMDNSRKVMLSIAKKLVERGVKVGFLPMHSIDQELANGWKEEIPELIIHPIPQCIEEAYSTFGQYSYALGERLHFVVLAILAKCPFISINYRRKHNDLFATLGLSYTGHLATDVIEEDLVTRIESPEGFDWGECQSRIEELVAIQHNAFSGFLEV